MNKKNQAGGPNTPQGGSKTGPSGEDRSSQQNQQSGSGGSQGSGERQADQCRQESDANPGARQAGSHEPKGNQDGK